jgi:NNP family nitrate/nitrite transporter-like MFS transporter
VPFVNAWFGRRERGLALGVYAMGNAGTALSGLLTPRLVLATNRAVVFLSLATLLIVVGISMWKWGRDAPDWRPNRVSALKRLGSALRWRPIWPLGALYAVTFGAFVAFGLYLPVVLTTRYDLSMVDAAARAAGFVLLATLARSVGGWLSDRLGALPVLRLVFTVAALLVLGIASEPSLMPVGTVLYLSLAVMLGMGNGAVFAYIGHGCPEKLVGTVSGIVGTAGGLGGFFPPLLMGASLQLTDSYAPALLLLMLICAAIAINLRRMMPATQGYK